MEEIEVKLKNNTPFCVLSQEFPDIRIYRWCSSVIDYVELYGAEKDLVLARMRLEQVTEELHSQVLSNTIEGRHVTEAIACRCSVDNSTIRTAETMNLLWEGPAMYEGGYEFLKLISFAPQDITRFFDFVTRTGEAEVTKKRRIMPDTLREIYTLSLSDILGGLSRKQMTYLRDAIGMGMFSSPRKIMVEDLAKVHGISKSTMQEHLNKARNKLIIAMEPYLNLFLHSH